MIKLMKYLKKSAGYIVLIIALLFLQAYCDLSLPDYTSKIINVGIQQKGIEDSVPDKLRDSTLQNLQIFMDEDQKKEVSQNYTQEEDTWVLNDDISKETRENLNEDFSKAMMMVSAFSEDSEQGQAMVAQMGLPEGTDPLTALTQMPEKAVQQIMSQVDEKLKDMPESIVTQAGVVGDPGTKPVGLCGSGIIDVISELYICGIINPKGKFIREGKRIKHDKYGMGSYILAFEEEAGSVKDVEITEVDIDNFIRAKGAIFSAIRTMLTSLDFDVSMIDDVYVAGGIGSGINMQNAVNIGMFPDIPIEKFHYIGNSSLTGAYLMLLSTPAEKKTYELAANMTYMELSTVPIYMDEFVGACFIPHTDTSMFPTVMEEVQNR